jgi:hypothetical protein
LKNNEPVQQKTNGEGDTKREHECGDVRADGNEWKIYDLFIKDEIVGDKK